MACTAASTNLLSSSNPRAYISPSKPFSQTLTTPISFNGLRKPFQSQVLRSISSRRSHHRRSSVVRASSELQLVGNTAPYLFVQSEIPEIPSSISPTPQRLPTNTQSEFQEKMLYLDSIGIDLLSLLTTHPPIVSASITDVKSIIEFLHSMGLTAPDLRRIFSMCPELLTSKISDLVPVFTFLLREAHVDGCDLRRVIHRRPRLLTCSVERRLRPTLYFLQSIGISEINRHTSLLSCSVEQKFVPRIDYLQKIGFSYRDTISMFRRFPSLFCYSIKENFELKFDYFVVEMGRNLKELKEFPQYFSFSLENRIKPRHRRCVEKGVCLSLPVMLKSSEERFRDWLEVCCNSSLPMRTSPLWCVNYDANVL